MPGPNPLVDFVVNKYYGGDTSQYDAIKEKLYNDPADFETSLQEGYNKLKSEGKTAAKTYGEFRTTFVGAYGGPAVVKKKENTPQDQNQAPPLSPNSPAGTSGDLFADANQPGTLSAPPIDAQNVFDQYKNSLPIAFAPDLAPSGGITDEELGADRSADTSTPSDVPPQDISLKTSPFEQTTQTDNPNIINNPISAAQRSQNGTENGIAPIGELDNTEKAQYFQDQKNQAIEDYKVSQMNGYDATMYYLNDFGGRVNKRILELPANTLDFIARTSYHLDKLTGTNPDKPYEDYVTGQWADQYRVQLDKYLGDVLYNKTESGGNTELDNTIQAKVAPAFADLMTVLAGGGGAANTGTKFLSQSALRNPNVTIGAFKELGTYVASPGSFISSTQIFNSEYEQAYTALREKGLDEQEARNQAWNSGMRNAIISAPLEMLPVSKFFDRLDDLSGGGLKTRVTSMMINGAKGFSEEAATEVAQQFFSNVDASLSYDETRQWTDGLIEAGLIGGLLGGTLSGVSSGLKYRRDTATDPKEKAEYQKSIDYVVEKQQEVETLQSENQTLKSAARIQNIDNGVTEILDKKDNISNDEIQQLEMLEIQKEDINKPMMDDLTRKTSGIDARIKDLILERELAYSSATTGIQIQKAAEREKEIGAELIGLYKEKYNARKKILRNQYIQKAQEQIANLNIQEDATRRRKETGGDSAEHIRTDQQLQEEGSNRNVAPKIEGGGNQAGNSNSLQQSGEESQEVNTGTQESPDQELIEEAKLPKTKPSEAIRKTAITIQGRSDIPKEVKARALANAVYPVKSLAVTAKEADDLLSEHITRGDDQALAYVLNIPDSVKEHVKVAIRASGLKHFAKKYNEAIKAGDKIVANEYAQIQSQIIDQAVKEQATETGRAANAYKLMKDASPEVHVIASNSAINKLRDEYKEKNKDRFATIASELNDTNKNIAGQTRKDKRIQGKLDQIKERKPKKEKGTEEKEQTERQKINKAKKEIKDNLSNLFKELNSRASSGIDPQLTAKILAEGAKYGYYLIKEGYYDFKSWSRKMRAELGDDAEPYLDDIWNASHEGQKLSSLAKSDKIKNKTERVVKENIDETFDKIVTQHYSEVEKKKSDLVDKLIDDLDISESDAAQLAKLVEDTFDRLSNEKKLSILKAKTKFQDKVYPKKLKQAYEKVIELSNVGSVDEKALSEIYADEFSAKELTEEQTTKLRELANRVQTTPDGFQKSRAIQDLYKFQTTLKGVNWTDIATSVWYANVLSGYKTHVTNSFANAVETVGELTVSMAKQPKNTGILVGGLLNGYRKGLLEARSTLATGYSPVKNEKVEGPNALEVAPKLRIPFTDVKIKHPFTAWKYVSRLMSAADAVAYSGLREMRASEMAADMARVQKKEFPDTKIWEAVSETLNNTKEKKVAAEAQAKEEGLSGLDLKRRVGEILEQNRSQEIIEDSADFALRGTFNGPADGTLGMITDAVAGVVEKVGFKGIKPLKYVVPFTRIVSNVANRYVEWTPWGYKRAIFGTGSLATEKYKRQYSADEKKKATIKATAGVLAMMAAYAMSDDDDGLIRITADGTGDVKKNYELAQKGWQKYSIKIGDKWYSYLNTPFAIPFAIIGNLRDNEKYKSESLDDKTIAETLFINTWKGMQFITDMTFLKGMSEFMSAFSEDTPTASVNTLKKVLSSAAKGYVVPNAYTQIAKDIMAATDTPMKQTSSFWHNFYRDIPGLDSGMYDMVNALGDPIVPDTDKFVSYNKIDDAQTAAAWDVIINNKAWIGKVSKNQLQSSLNDTGWEGEVSDREYYEYSKTRGAFIKKRIIANIGKLDEMTPGDVKDEIDSYKREATIEAKEEIFGIKKKKKKH